MSDWKSRATPVEGDWKSRAKPVDENPDDAFLKNYTGDDIYADIARMSDNKAIKKMTVDSLRNHPQLNPDDFTKPGEPIPKDAGFVDFGRYNLARFNPTSKENLMGMAGGSGGITTTKPIGEGLKTIGKALYKSGFAPLDAVSAQFKKTPVSDIAFKYGMTGSNKSIGKQAAEKLSELSTQKGKLLNEAEQSGIVPSIQNAFKKAEEYADELLKSRAANDREAGVALKAEIQRQKEPLLAQQGPVNPNVESAPLAGPANINDLERVKQTMYGGLPESSFKAGSQSSKDLGNRGQKLMARGAKDEVLNTMEQYKPEAKQQVSSMNDDIGGLLTTAAAMNKEAIKAGNKNLLTSVDPIAYTLGYGSGMGRSGGEGGTLAVILKKLADLSKTTMFRTNVGKGMYNLGDYASQIPNVVDKNVITPSAWMYLNSNKENK